MQSYVFFRNQTTFATILPQISISGGALVSSAPTKQTVEPPTDCTDLHRTSCWGCSPTDFTDFTETLAEWSLPQISQIYTEAANFRGCTCLRSALPLTRARSAPTKQTVVLPQISQIYTEAANFRGCTCLKCTNQARSAPTEQYRYTSCYVGALETSAPPWRHPNNLCRSAFYVKIQMFWPLFSF